MKSGKPQDQSLAIAYSVKRKPKKKMAQGGKVNESAASEHRPNPEERDKDAKSVSRNSGNKPPKQDSWTDQPTVTQARKPSLTKLSRPKIVGSDAFSVRSREEVEAGLDQIDSYPPQSPKAKAPRRLIELDADKSGPDTPSLHMKKMANGGEVSFEESEEDHAVHPEGLEEDNDQMKPPSSRYMSGQNQMLAEGGEVERDHEDSIAAAIMAKRDRMHAAIDSGARDLDEAVRMAEGGEVGDINGRDSIYSDDSDQADLSRNAEEDANMEDQASFDALRKENYSESEGLAQVDNPEDSGQHGDDREDSESDKHDMAEAIRRKMSAKRQFKSR